LELKKVIKELLTSHNFISLPGLGSFVQSYEPAKLAADGKSFLPPNQAVTFDLNRTFNDEVLELYIQDRHATTGSEAMEQVKTFVEEVKKSLDSGEEVEFESVGYLKKNEAGQVELIQKDDNERISATFGLKEVKATEKRKPASHAKPKQTSKANVIEPKAKESTKVKKSTIAVASIAAVIILGLIVGGAFFLFPELRFWDKPSTLAVIVIENDNNIASDSIHEVDSTQVFEVNDSLETTGSLDVVILETDKKSALYYEEPVVQEQKTYYIIAGSFAKIENAQVLFTSLEKKGHKPEIVNSDGRFRVAISKFTDRNRALRELERLRREKPNDPVWLLGL